MAKLGPVNFNGLISVAPGLNSLNGLTETMRKTVLQAFLAIESSGILDPNTLQGYGNGNLDILGLFPPEILRLNETPSHPKRFA